MPFTVPAEPASAAALLLGNAERMCSWVRRIAVATGLILGGSNLLVWLHGSVPTVAVSRGMMVMRMNTAVGLTAAALSLACWSRVASGGRRRLAQGLAVIPALIGALTAIQDVAIVNLGVDQLLAPD